MSPVVGEGILKAAADGPSRAGMAKHHRAVDCADVCGVIHFAPGAAAGDIDEPAVSRIAKAPPDGRQPSDVTLGHLIETAAWTWDATECDWRDSRVADASAGNVALNADHPVRSELPILADLAAADYAVAILVK
jgi:hypothetical protein